MDVVEAAEVWADPDVPTAVLADPPAPVMDYLTSRSEILCRVLANDAVPDQLKGRLMRAAGRWVREALVDDAFELDLPIPQLRRLAPAFTAATLRRLLNYRPHDRRFVGEGEERQQRRTAAIVEAFAAAPEGRCRALAAEAFRLNFTGSHDYSQGTISAVVIAADADIAVRVGLARNDHLRHADGTRHRELCRALLEDPAPRVRTAARRAGLHVSDEAVHELMHAVWEGRPLRTDLSPISAVDPLDDPSPSIRATVVASIAANDAAGWVRILDDPSPRVRAAVATRGYSAPRFVWTSLITDAEPSVRKAVAKSRLVPPHLRRQLLTDPDPTVAREAAARNSHEPAPAQRSFGEHTRRDPLANHPRAQQVIILTGSLAGLTDVTQQRLVIEAARNVGARAGARMRTIEALASDVELASCVMKLWARWASILEVAGVLDIRSSTAVRYAGTFTDIQVADALERPYRQDGQPGDVITCALAFFDAVLATLGAPTTTDGERDLELLTQPWRLACGDQQIAAATMLGPATRNAFRALRQMSASPYSARDAMLLARARMKTDTWESAADTTRAVARLEGFPYRLPVLHEIAADAAAAGEPEFVDPLLVQAFWGAAAVALMGKRLTFEARRTLSDPAKAAGLAR
ncbi:hypothetical protein ACWDUL_20440 [Nocardia niigatensis]